MPSLEHGDYRMVSHTKHFGVGPKEEAKDGNDLQTKQSTRAPVEKFPCVDFNKLKKISSAQLSPSSPRRSEPEHGAKIASFLSQLPVLSHKVHVLASALLPLGSVRTEDMSIYPVQPLKLSHGRTLSMRDT